MLLVGISTGSDCWGTDQYYLPGWKHTLHLGTLEYLTLVRVHGRIGKRARVGCQGCVGHQPRRETDCSPSRMDFLSSVCRMATERHGDASVVNY